MSTAYDGSTPVLAISFPGVNLFPTKLGGMNWVHVFSPSLVNSARVGFTRTVWAQNFPIDTTGQFGTNGNAKVGISFSESGLRRVYLPEYQRTHWRWHPRVWRRPDR